VLDQHDEIRDAVVTRLERGHTNESYALSTPIGRYVLRRAWAGKPATQIAAEETVLTALAAPTHPLAFDVPRIIPTRANTRHGLDGDRVVHLMSECRGVPGPRYLACGDHERMHAAMTTLAHLHRALARVAPEPPQWLHGDYHLGNLLWTGNTITGVVDFDDTVRGSPATEAAMALFALARQPDECTFVYDGALWNTGHDAYLRAGGVPIAGDRDELTSRFCAYQVLIHLAATHRKLWALDAGIGFWPCLRYLAHKRRAAAVR
jgi:Ser/Thr protein kinase RdoA (MazF antagonist)